ncbi:PH domain-containing protein [Candidatus Saccharibacteria bacterium]|nr:PH domain-containing protein [Candidatus Saccharibacteria bacterium]MDQ5885134.1 hypothetical protein [Patescibacteria group bacterium]MDQ5953729.1 hypothetical protein [Patescibacteria group bacterium]MDQ5958274.1 hypothetical protein [Patescibacteria group bacterium]
MEAKLLHRSRSGLESKIISTGVIALILGLAATIVISIMFSWTKNQGWFLIAGTWLILFFGWGYTAIRSKIRWDRVRYEITPESIIIYEKAGKLGGSKTVYRYESIISVRMTQDYLGKRYGFGDVHIVIPKLDKELVLKDIDRPDQQLNSLQANIEARGSTAATHSLIN